MKTSSKLFVATLLLLFGSLTAYNMALRAEYVHGTYRTRFATTPRWACATSTGCPCRPPEFWA